MAYLRFKDAHSGGGKALGLFCAVLLHGLLLALICFWPTSFAPKVNLDMPLLNLSQVTIGRKAAQQKPRREATPPRAEQPESISRPPAEQDAQTVLPIADLEEELRRIEELEAQKQAEEIKKLAEAKKLEEEKLLAEQKRLEEEKRLAEEKRLTEQKLAEEKKLAEEQRKAEEKRKAEEQRLAEEKRQAEEKRLAEEKRKTEERRLAAERKRAAELKEALDKAALDAALEQAGQDAAEGGEEGGTYGDGAGDGVGILGEYIDSVRSRIQPFLTTRPRADGVIFEARVRLEIADNGLITKADLVESSGDAVFDADVLRAIREAGQLEPPPSREYQSLVVPFTSAM